MTQSGKVAAYKKYAKDIKDAAELYSGTAANNAMTEAAKQEGIKQQANNVAMSQDQGQNNTMAEALAGQNAVSANDGFGSGFAQGAINKKTDLDAKYNAATTEAQAALNQANIDTNVKQQMANTAWNAAGGMADLYKNTKSDATSDERMKDDLPSSDIEDSLRQIDEIQYKYKDPEYPGCDDEIHKSGFTAQSIEDEPLFKDVVSENEDGVKQIDKWKLLEAVTAGIGQLQKEIDELKGAE